MSPERVFYLGIFDVTLNPLWNQIQCTVFPPKSSTLALPLQICLSNHARRTLKRTLRLMGECCTFVNLATQGHPHEQWREDTWRCIFLEIALGSLAMWTSTACAIISLDRNREQNGEKISLDVCID